MNQFLIDDNETVQSTCFHSFCSLTKSIPFERLLTRCGYRLACGPARKFSLLGVFFSGKMVGLERIRTNFGLLGVMRSCVLDLSWWRV